MIEKTKRAVLGLDVGSVRIGVAISDELLIAAYPLEIVEGAIDKRIARLVEIIKERGVAKIAVGMPYSLNGEIEERGIEVRKFCDKLTASIRKSLNIEMELFFVDERMTSKQAERVLSGSKLRNKERSKAIDKIAAAIILETYLQTQNH